MEQKEMQRLIDCTEPAAMLRVARAYLDGDILRDRVAAEAWLLRAVDAGEPVTAAKAMGILARELWQIDEPLSDADVLDLRRAAQEQGASQELRTLLELASERQKKLDG